MTKIIPPELIAHLEWNPDRQASRRVQHRTASIDALVNRGKTFYSNQRDENNEQIVVAAALQDLYDQMGQDAIVASLPYLIAGKAKADKSNYLWQTWFNALTEENTGIDTNGRLVGRGEGIVLTLHGGGILTPERIMQAYKDELTPQNAAKYTDEEFNDLLNGMLPSGESIELYTVDDVKKGRIPEPFGRYAVWMPLETALSKESADFKKKDFMDNELVIARAGTLEYLEEYFDKAKGNLTEKVGNFHRLYEIYFRQPLGSVLLIYQDYHGLDSQIGIFGDSRFIGVTQEAER